MRKFVGVVKWIAIVVVVGAAGALGLNFWSQKTHAKNAPPKEEPAARLAVGDHSTLVLADNTVKQLGVKTYQVTSAGNCERLRLSGSLYLDPNRMVRVHSRFPGEVVSLGTADGSRKTKSRSLRLGDPVKKGQLLAIIWSKDIGEKKSDLVNALSQLYLDEAQLARLRRLEKGTVPERTIHEAERQYESDVIEVERVERTLRSWRLTDDEIQRVAAEAERLHRGDVKGLKIDPELAATWAEIDVKAPFDGVVLEKNIAVGDIVDTSLDLMKIADLSTLGVMAHVYEDDLPAIQALEPDQRHWTISLKSQPRIASIEAPFDIIGNLIDPSQHTAVVMGSIENKNNNYRAGQFITADVCLPAAQEEVAVPDSAVIDDGDYSTVFVAADDKGSQVTRRKVAVIRRGDEMVFIHSEPTQSEKAAGCEPLRVGEWVVASGVIELSSALDDQVAILPATSDSKN